MEYIIGTIEGEIPYLSPMFLEELEKHFKLITTYNDSNNNIEYDKVTLKLGKRKIAKMIESSKQIIHHSQKIDTVTNTDDLIIIDYNCYNNNESIKNRLKDIKHVNNKIFVIDNHCNMDDIIEYKKLGCSMIKTDYPLMLANLGYVIDHEQNIYNINDSSYLLKSDMQLKNNCKCFTCENHSQAYVHHLISLREILGLTLLYNHNLFAFLQFLSEL